MTAKTKPVRNGQIDFWRFFGILMIVIGHSNKLLADPPLADVFAVWVDFFFIVTGYFTAVAIAKAATPCDMNTLGTETVAFTLKKVKSFYLFFLFACLAALGAKTVLYGAEEVFLNWKLFGAINDLTLIYATGIPSMGMTVGEWYLSAMVLALAVLYPLARRYPDLFQNVLAPLAAVFLYGIMLHNEGILTDPGTWYGIGLKGFVRAIAGTSLGFVAHRLASGIEQSPYFDRRVGKVLITVADVLAIPFALLLMLLRIDAAYSSAIIFFLFAGVVTSLSGKSLFTRLFSNRLCVFLGKLGLPAFLCQGAIIYLLKAYQNARPAFEVYCNSAEGKPVMLIALAVGTILLALVCLWICEPLTRFIDKKVAAAKATAPAHT